MASLPLAFANTQRPFFAALMDNGGSKPCWFLIPKSGNQLSDSNQPSRHIRSSIKPTAINATPLICFSVLVIFAAMTAFETGQSPTYGNPDPKHSTSGYLTPCVRLFVILGLVSTLALPSAYMISPKLRKATCSPRPGAIPAAGIILWVIDFTLLHTSKFSLISWILD